MSITEDVIVGSVKVNFPVTRQFVDDLLVTAFEGGINYWCSAAYPVNNEYPDGATYTSDCLSRGKDIVIIEDGENGPEGHILTLDNLIYAMKSFMNEPNANNIFEDYDACDADVIVQYAIFGEVIYG